MPGIININLQPTALERLDKVREPLGLSRRDVARLALLDYIAVKERVST